MKAEDYPQIKALWKSIRGFGIRSVDDSEEGVIRFLKRNPGISCVAEENGEIIGSILCGHDGRTGFFYHVCVAEAHRKHGYGTAMVVYCMEALKAENINKVALIAFRKNDIGNHFWKKMGWRQVDANYYDFVLNDANITAFNAD